VPGLDGVELDPDILAETETIRRERLERRERRQKKATATTIPPPIGAVEEVKARSEIAKEPKAKEEARVLVGNLIGEDHVNYVLMYNMLTGIRIGVSWSLLHS
jgi:1-phosphatidylinositol-4-phosphate 5-kinase